MDSRRNPSERPRNGGSIASHYDERTFAQGRGMDQFVLSTTEGRVALLTLNRLAAGSAFQVALLGDMRVGHPGVTMGQPEINSGIASVTGPWIMREMLGLARTVDLTLTGRMMAADECHAIGLINRLVPENEVRSAAMTLAAELAEKPPVAMRLNKARFREVTEAGFRECIAAGIRNQREAYGTGEPARMMQAFLAKRAERKG